MARALPTLAFLVLVALPAVAAAHPLPMVMYAPPQHEAHVVALGAFGSGGVATSFDGASPDGLGGGGVALSIAGSRGFESLTFAGDVRVRLLDAVGPGGRTALTLPIDLLARMSVVHYGRAYSTGCDRPMGPSELCIGVDRHDPDPVVPYVGAGATLAFAVSPGDDVRGGPVVVGGVEVWVDPRLALFAELDARLLFGAPDAALQVALELGVWLAP